MNALEKKVKIATIVKKISELTLDLFRHVWTRLVKGPIG